jgi:hypothetical protein
LSAGNGGSFNHGAAPEVLARARRELTQTIQDTVPVVVDVRDTAEQLIETTGKVAGVEALTFKALIPLPKAAQDATVAVGQFAKTVITSGENMSKKLMSALSGIGGMMPQQQVGKKRGFFSKLLGVAAPFLGMIPGVGPLLSTLAGMGSAAAGGDWGSVLTQGVAGFSSGGAFRGSGGGNSGNAFANVTQPGQTNTNIMFGGPRARGGPVSRGRAYLVGEHQPEVVQFGDDGYVHPSIDSFTRQQRGGGGNGGHDHGFWQEFRAEIARLSGAVGNFDQKISSMPPEHVVSTVARSHPQLFGEGLMRAGSRDPQVVDWMRRRTA